MSHPNPDYDPWRPIAPQLKWLIVGIVALLLGAWELLFHLTLMGLPMVTGHRLNALVAALLVTGTILAFFLLIQSYERQMAAVAGALLRKNREFRIHETDHDLRLLNLAGDLALALVEINNQCEIALACPESAGARETLVSVKARAEELFQVERALVDLERDGAALVDNLPPILADYEQRRGAGSAPRASRNAPWSVFGEGRSGGPAGESGPKTARG